VNLLRLLAKKILLLLNVLAVLVFLVACLVPYIGPDRFWPISFLGLAFPYILMVVAAFFVFWLIFRTKYSFLSLIALILGWKSISVLFAFHPGSAPPAKDPADQMTVMSYNVRYFKDFDYSPAKNARLRTKIMTLIRGQHPDILCLQEFYTSENPHDDDNKAYLSKELHLPYRYFSSDHNFENNHSGVILFSRYPIIHTAKVKLLEHSTEESAVYADIVRGRRDTFRLFTVHLQSVYLSHKDLAGLQKMKMQEDTGFQASRVILGKLRKAFLKREHQAQKVAEEISQSPYPVILCGDFNDTPNSYAYFKIRGGMQDAFLKRGFGIGRTYSGIAPTLRIDYIFASPVFTIHSFNRIKRVLSDHYPIIAQLSLKKDEPGG
jgi:endonuclease/exonuclease/phosphatase family metal-dependent hydrolase